MSVRRQTHRMIIEQLHGIVIKSDTIHVMVKFSVVNGYDDALRRRRSDIFYFCQ